MGGPIQLIWCSRQLIGHSAERSSIPPKTVHVAPLALSLLDSLHGGHLPERSHVANVNKIAARANNHARTPAC